MSEGIIRIRIYWLSADHACYLPEKQMIFLFVPVLAVSTRFMFGRVICLTDLVWVGGEGEGVMALGAMMIDYGNN